jgi:hypothetical protein
MNRNYVENCCLKAPGLAIGGGSKYTAKTGNTFQVKVNGIISAPLTTADVPALTTSVGRTGAANVLGTAVLATKMCRFYTVLAAVSATTSAMTLSLVHGDDFSLLTDIGRVKYINPGNTADDLDNKAVVGYICVQNGAAGNFTPGSTALDATSTEAAYVDQFGFTGM